MPKHYGLRLTLGGAPHTPHVIPGVPGVYRPERATPIGGPGELAYDEAKRFAQDPGTHLELVELRAGEVEVLRASVAEDLTAARTGLAESVRSGALEPAEVERAIDEKAAVAAPDEED